MAIKPVNKGTYSIPVDDTSLLLLSITIGNAQIGGNLLELDGQVVAKGKIKDFALGNGKGLRGKMLKVTTNVLDVNPSSNRISITHYFRNGTSTVFQYPEHGDDPGVDNAGDIYSLEANYKFV